MQLFWESRPRHLIAAATVATALLAAAAPGGAQASIRATDGSGETAVVVPGGMVPAHGKIAAAGRPAAAKIPSCHSITYKGSAGAIRVQTSKNGYVAWGIYMYNSKLDAGPWNVDVYVGSRRADHRDQNYAPHGSVDPKDAKKEKTFHITATHHADANGKNYVNVPNECVIP
jgi:hypothetical protein